MAMPLSRTLPRLLSEIASRYPENEAIVADTARLTYCQLEQQVF